MSRSSLNNTEYTRILETITTTTIQNTSSDMVVIAVLSSDVKPVDEVGFILEKRATIKIPSGKFIYGKSKNVVGSIEVVNV